VNPPGPALPTTAPPPPSGAGLVASPAGPFLNSEQEHLFGAGVLKVGESLEAKK